MFIFLKNCSSCNKYVFRWLPYISNVGQWLGNWNVKVEKLQTLVLQKAYHWHSSAPARIQDSVFCGHPWCVLIHGQIFQTTSQITFRIILPSRNISNIESPWVCEMVSTVLWAWSEGKQKTRTGYRVWGNDITQITSPGPTCLFIIYPFYFYQKCLLLGIWNTLLLDWTRIILLIRSEGAYKHKSDNRIEWHQRRGWWQDDELAVVVHSDAVPNPRTMVVMSCYADSAVFQLERFSNLGPSQTGWVNGRCAALTIHWIQKVCALSHPSKAKSSII